MKKLTTSPSQSNPFLDRWLKISGRLPHAPAIFSPDGRTLHSFSSLNRSARSWADRILPATRPAARPLVSIEIPNCPDWPAVLLGIWMAGGVAIPCTSPLPDDLSANARIVPDQSGQPALVACSRQPAGIHPAADLLKLTSGTSSGGRAVAFSAAQLLADAANIHHTMGIARPDRNVGAIPLSHSYGLSNLFGLLAAEGIPLILCDPLPRSILQALTEGRGSVLPIVPAMVRALSSVGGPAGSLRLCVSAGALLPEPDALAFFESFGKKVHTFYGASECGGICFDATDTLSVPQGFLGTPLRGVSVIPESRNEEFSVRVESGAVAIGYLPPDSASGDGISPGTFRPADILCRHGNGFRMIGRQGDWINVAGRKVNPLEIETVLRSLPGIRDCAVFGLPDPTGRGEQVAACIVGPASPDLIRPLCPARLPAWQIPRRWFVLDSLPVDDRGKLSRRRLRELFS